MLALFLTMIDSESDRVKFMRLYNEYRHTMYRTANAILKDSYLAEDAVQEAFVRIIKNLHKIDGADSRQTKVFLAIIVKNVSLTMQARHNAGLIFSFDDAAEPESASEYSLADEIESKEGLSNLLEVIDKLPSMYKNPLLLKYYIDLEVGEIAQSLGLPLKTVQKQIERGRQILAERLKEKSVSI
ncbi:MAG: sigma-70 family RNA polymerase sigma factor [Oscillospiraceae bacterium]|jgi:RNA polymerase sigma-70 factor (ECF subfamily)|nr:sigma-70 family RNA polymerase sigma factor [Oscillospiraceae bacterium]